MKNKKNILKSNKKLFVALSSLALITVVGVTMAYIYFSSSFENRFKTSAYNISLEEEFYDDWGVKRIKISSNDKTDLILRISYNEVWGMEGDAINSTSCKVNYMVLDDEQVLTLSNKIGGVDVVTKEWTETWLNDFVLSDDGWYYYKKVLNQDDTIQILESIQLNRDLISGTTCYENYTDFEYSLDFDYEAIQATELAVQEIWNHNITIDGNTITWDF